MQLKKLRRVLKRNKRSIMQTVCECPPSHIVNFNLPSLLLIVFPLGIHVTYLVCISISRAAKYNWRNICEPAMNLRADTKRTRWSCSRSGLHTKFPKNSFSSEY